MKRLVMSAAALGLALGLSAGAPDAAEAGSGAGQAQAKPQAPAVGQPAGPVAKADEIFAREAAVGGLAEVQLGKLATQRAASADVKQFGQRMVSDHSKANEELESIAAKKQMTLPTEVSPKFKNLHDRLSKLSGAEFDRGYMSEMVKDHEEDIASFRRQSTRGRDPELKAFATKALPTLEKHLEMAREITAKLDGTADATKKTPEQKDMPH